MSDDLTGIYALCDPVNHEIMYVGQSKHIYRRYKQHCGLGGCGRGRTPKSKWLINLRMQGKKPVLLILEKTSISELDTAEMKWIQYYRHQGYAQLNSAINFVPFRRH